MKATKKALAAGSIILALAACSSGGDKKDNSNTGTTTPSATASASKVSEGGTTYKVDPNTKARAPEKSDPSATFKTPVKSGAIATNISIPSIKVNKEIKNMGLNKNGNLEPPQGVLQWYNKTSSPGTNGISVLAGHVSYNDVPDVFWNLHDVKTGDKVSIKYSDGTTKNFKIVRKGPINKKDLQYDATVWGSLNATEKEKASMAPSLVLATCDADSRLVGHHHVDNYVAWAIPTE